MPAYLTSMRTLLIILIALLLSCKNSTKMDTTSETKFSNEQIARKKNSEEIAKLHNVPVNATLPYTEAEHEVTLRSKDEIVDRALALCYVALKGEGLEQAFLNDFEKRYKVKNKLSPEEKEFAFAASPTQQQTTNAVWRYESLQVMLWALGYIDNLDYPDSICNVAQVVTVFRTHKDEASFRQNAKLRTKKEILDQTDLIYRLDWACVDARLKNKQAPGNLEAGVVYERHYSLNWLTNYMEQEWDDISTDT
jgi:hypothetical protein